MTYDGPVKVGMVFTAPDNDLRPGYRRVKVIGRDADDGHLLIKEMPSRMRVAPGMLGKIPEHNLRVVFEPEDRVLPDTPDGASEQPDAPGEDAASRGARVPSDPHERRYMESKRTGVLSTAVGIARLRFRDGNFQGASDVLDDAVDECHVLHFDACIADGHDPAAVERFLGPRDQKVERARL